MPGTKVAPAGLTCTNIHVRFGGTLALTGVDFQVAPGEIVGLLGHNGAGKSTLVNVITGSVSKYSGEVRIGGEVKAERATPKQIAAQGVAVLHQEPALAMNLSVEDNLFVAQPAGTVRSSRRNIAEQALARVGAHVDLERPIRSMGLGERQLVGLARGLIAGDIEVLLLDEPTAALGKEETDYLHKVIRQFAAEGTAVVYISHRLPDVFDVCDRIVVLREGKVQLSTPTSEVNLHSIGSALAPGVVFQTERTRHDRSSTAALQVKASELSSTLKFSKGEVVGLFGMAGGQQFEVLNSIYGIGGPVEIELYGELLSAHKPSQALKKGIHLVPADREQDGLLSNLSAIDNVFLPWLKRKKRNEPGQSGRSDLLYSYPSIREMLNVRGPTGEASIDAFSGGNKQKHLVARWSMPVLPRVLLLAQPTQGVDVQAKSDIRKLIFNLADQGVIVLVASAETDEIASMCDRSYVFGKSTLTEVLNSGAGFETRLLEALLNERKGI